MSDYVLSQLGAQEFERERLALLAEVTDPFTLAQLDVISVQPGWRCVDIGAGSGSVTRMLAARAAAAGTVLAVDLDTRVGARNSAHLMRPAHIRVSGH
jgi:precorrin-6B methylase 2